MLISMFNARNIGLSCSIKKELTWMTYGEALLSLVKFLMFLINMPYKYFPG